MTLDHAPIPCPSCGLSGHNHKISLIYLQASARLSGRPLPENSIPGREEPDLPALDAALADLLPHGSRDDLRRLLRQFERAFAPPPPPSVVVPPIHPDWMVFFGVGVGVLFAAWILLQGQATNLSAAGSSASTALPVIFSLLAVVLLAYLLTRRPVMNRYLARLRAGQEASRQHALAAERWLRLYFCSLEPVVFDPDLHIVRPLDQLHDLLYSEHS